MQGTVCAAACIGAAFLFFYVYRGDLYENAGLLELGMQVCILLITGVTGLACIGRKEKAGSYIMMGILAAGVVMRIGYMLYTPYNLRGHDIDVIGGDGHAAYIISILEGHLPETNDYQFYHPPLFHALAAGMCRLFRQMTGIEDLERVIEAGKIISCWASIGTLFLSAELGRELQIGKRAEIVVVCVAAFLPEHYLLAGRLNNDSLSVMFMAAVILYTIRWYRTRSLADILVLALSFGLGMMSKLSVGMLAFVTGPVMIAAFFKDLKRKRGGRCIGQLFIFGMIAFPLGMWYPVRNLLKFEQPFTYVYPVEADGPLFCGDHGIIERFLPMWETHIYADPYEDYNVWGYLLRTSVFGEFRYEVPDLLPAVLLAAAGCAAIAATVVMIGRWFRRPDYQHTVLSLTWVCLIASYIWFNVQNPFGCTMDFRYVVPTALIGSIFLGEWLGNGRENVLKSIVSVCLFVFSVTSCVMFTVI